ncbi:hypothetical protein [Candidatus Odyssella thessalonicensis]|uniref:hypothetical protein n=1 Tax=Candidatus Odyssella thessalonicensis TaxID=84647 RepID=UPI000225AC7D|nr:hypothetical protein [Candidatus Odyssella thessalonicensis]
MVNKGQIARGAAAVKVVTVALVSCSWSTLTLATQTYTVTVGTDTPTSPIIPSGGAPGTGYDLRGAILAANASGYSSIAINFSFGSATKITLGNNLPMISNYTTSGAPMTRTWTFNGNGNTTIDGASSYRGFFLSQIPSSTTKQDLDSANNSTSFTLTIQNMTLQNMRAQGGAGHSGGGGGWYGGRRSWVY